MANNAQNNAERKLINLNLDSFLISTIKRLGRYDSLDADLIGILVENIEYKVQKLNEQILQLHKHHLAKQDHAFDQKEQPSTFKSLKSKKIESLLAEKGDLLKQLHELKAEKVKFDKPMQRQIEATRNIGQLSDLLANQSNRPAKDIEAKLNALYEMGSEPENPLSYNKLNV